MSFMKYKRAQIALQQSNLPSVAQHMFSLMLRNMASDGFVFTDPYHLGVDFSTRGCIIASPSYAISGSSNDTIVTQDYVYNWTRDSAVAAMELAAANIPFRPGEGVQPLIDYVNFAIICQQNAVNTTGFPGPGGQPGPYPIGYASYTIEGKPREKPDGTPAWTEQTDGPALQTLAILQAFPQLDAPTQATARTVIGANINYLLGGSPPKYQSPTINLWEEVSGESFFALAVQLRCFQQITSNTYGITVPPATAAAITWLQNALQTHWNGTYYISMVPPPTSFGHTPYDPNIDIVLASVYGAIPYTDTKLLATAALLRNQWANSSSSTYYPINGADLQSLGYGPMLGRYPGDIYDGDNDQSGTGHPWALCTAAFAELYYGLANAITKTQTVPFDDLSANFFSQIGVVASTPWSGAVSSLQSAGDAMLNALIFHSDRLELSEQFDKTSGYEKSVSDLTWSYAAFLSAVRAKTGQSVLG